MTRYTASRVAQEINGRPAFLADGPMVGSDTVEAQLSAALQALATANPDAEQLAFLERQAMMAAAYGFTEPTERKPFAFSNGVAIVPIHGVLINRFPYSWGFVTGYDFIRRQTEAAAADLDVRAIVYDIHSPGGTVAGCPETYSAIMALRGSKPTLAVVDSAAYSAAYYLASAADKIAVTPSGGVGSIGVVAARLDVTEMLAKDGVKVTFVHAGAFKLDGNPATEMTSEERDRIQASVDFSYDGFVAAVAAGRGMDEKKVRATEAACYGAEEALRLGLVNDIMTPAAAVQAALSNLDEDNDPMAENTQVDVAALQAEARQAERARSAGILGCDEAKDRPALAKHLATETDMTVDQAKAVLAVAASEVQAAAPTNILEAAMDRAGTPGVGEDGPAPGSHQSKTAQLLADFSAATGEKFN